jgi:1-acyl-sn-glycerol-3-phosphate acyltransferase
MTFRQLLTNSALHGLTSLLCRVDTAQLERMPERGPLILVANHINFLEIPVLYTRLGTRPIVVFTKAETWDSFLMRGLFDLSRAIPVRRGEADATALRRAAEVLETGHILAVAPEGTRSGDGCLQRGHPGVVVLALRTHAPLLPIAYYGGENIRHNLPRLKRTDFHVVVGQPFYLQAEGKVTRETRQQMVDEIMYQIAALLPPAYRGHYSNLDVATEQYLRFPASSESNLHWERSASWRGTLAKISDL